MIEKKSAVGWILEMTTIIGSFIACFMMLYSQIDKLDQKIEKQAARTDRIYEMYCDFQKDMDKRMQVQDQKFYDLLKEQRK